MSDSVVNVNESEGALIRTQKLMIDATMIIVVVYVIKIIKKKEEKRNKEGRSYNTITTGEDEITSSLLLRGRSLLLLVLDYR